MDNANRKDTIKAVFWKGYHRAVTELETGLASSYTLRVKAVGFVDHGGRDVDAKICHVGRLGDDAGARASVAEANFQNPMAVGNPELLKNPRIAMTVVVVEKGSDGNANISLGITKLPSLL